jgi:adenylate cyclase
MNDRLPRKLAAILYADVVEYSRLTGDDEDVTHRALSEYLDLIAQIIESHRGQVMHYAGDAVLAKFDAVVDAVTAATEIQEQLLVRNDSLPELRKVQFRIGINSGDVIEDRGDIYGDGVNVAARLEALAAPSGICISDAVRTAVGNKLGLAYEDLGEQQVKNISEAVRAYKVVAVRKEEMKANNETSSSLKLAEEPSIAVLPFTNMSSDPEQEYFSDGITEDIITALSKISALMVIARNSTFIYKGKAVDIKQVGRDQGVRYVLEGSVRKSGSRVRITAQLIDAITGHHKWAEHYDRNIEDIFAVQDEITRKIVSELDVHLKDGEQARYWSSSTDNLEAWECFRLARDLHDAYRMEDLPEVIRLLQKAIDIDPGYAAAWTTLSGCHFHVAEDARYSEEQRKQATQLTQDCAEQALKCDPFCASAYSMLGLYHLNLREFDEATDSTNKSIELAPNHAYNIAVSAIVLNKCGQPARASERIRKAMRLSPIHPGWYLSTLGQVSRAMGQAGSAIDAYMEMTKRDPDSLEGYIGLAEILGEVDRIEEAKKSAVEVIRVNPDFSINEYVGNLAYRDPAEIKRFAEGLRKAGLPE